MPSTTNYGMFKIIEGNRGTIPSHIKKLVEAIEQKNLLSEFPILVNENFEIIDGQHRLMAAAQLNLPLHYQVIKGLSLSNVMSINTASRSWGLRDFVQSYAELGNTDYKELLEFATEFGLGLGHAASLLEGRGGHSGGSTAERIRQGKFSINARRGARRVAEALVALDKIADFNAKADRKLSNTIAMLLSNEDFSVERLTGKYKTHGLALRKRHSERYYLIDLEDAYNFNTKTERVELYKGQI